MENKHLGTHQTIQPPGWLTGVAQSNTLGWHKWHTTLRWLGAQEQTGTKQHTALGWAHMPYTKVDDNDYGKVMMMVMTMQMMMMGRGCAVQG